ncbi:MAG: arginyltransferase [Gemmataceae bacterium]|nr:arginyltransferase [Gemmata sp.]MDW8199550.1 arginyltransferase [Gemmataceae bacterium]
MRTLAVVTSPPRPCGYLPQETWSLTYELVGELTAAEYEARLRAGWRRFGYTLFRPTCPACTKCLSLRIPAASFRPDRSQRRCWATNDGVVKLVIGEPSVTAEKLALYDRYHTAQAHRVGWPEHEAKDAADYIESFVENPFITQEWCYYQGNRLVGVGYVDRLPQSLSAIYFYYDPDEMKRSLGTFNILSLIQQAQQWQLAYVYLGYYVEGCRSLEYKARFRPNEVLNDRGQWVLYRP